MLWETIPNFVNQLRLQARVGGMLSGKAGLVYCHMGTGGSRLQPLRDALAVNGSDLPITQFLPTHMSRSGVCTCASCRLVRLLLPISETPLDPTFDPQTQFAVGQHTW